MKWPFTNIRSNLLVVCGMLTVVSWGLLQSGQWELAVGVISHLAYPVKMLVDANDDENESRR